ncbi:Uncharacterised protein [Mycobacteroides abscessus subsp. massiliense]|nr:Uncharacterised protein [Mycobacteroides abscessus subsp. massiliense]
MRDGPQARPLYQCENHHQHKHDVQQAIAVGYTRDDGKGRQHDGYGTAQSGPGQKCLFAPGNAKSDERYHHRERPSHQQQNKPHQDGGHQVIHQLTGIDQ